MLLLWAETEQRWAEGESGDHKTESLALAWRLTDRAAACLPENENNLAVWRQRAVLSRALRRDDYDALAQKAERLTPRTSEDHYYLARALSRRHETKKAIDHLLKAIELDPKHFWARITWKQLLRSRRLLASDRLLRRLRRHGSRFGPSVLCLLSPWHGVPAQGAFAAAIADLERAVEYLPSLPADLAKSERPKLSLLLAEGLTDRGKQLSKQADFAAADDVLTKALSADGDVMRLYLLRAEVRTLRGDKIGADRDWQAVLKMEPADERDWTFRGYSASGTGRCGRRPGRL